jgi:predicted nuclease of restriction endonuclease-like (RecB) superfamily
MFKITTRNKRLLKDPRVMEFLSMLDRIMQEENRSKFLFNCANCLREIH